MLKNLQVILRKKSLFIDEKDFGYDLGNTVLLNLEIVKEEVADIDRFLGMLTGLALTGEYKYIFLPTPRRLINDGSSKLKELIMHALKLESVFDIEIVASTRYTMEDAPDVVKKFLVL